MKFWNAINSLLNWEKSPILKDVQSLAKWSKNHRGMTLKEVMRVNKSYRILVWLQLGGMVFSTVAILNLLIPHLFSGLISFRAILLSFLNVDLDAYTLLGKTAWEWMNLLLIPIVLSMGGFIARNILENKEREQRLQEALKNYYSEISSIILNEKWTTAGDAELNHQSAYYKKALAVVRAKTIALVRELDKERLSALLQFLGDSNILINVPLENLDLSGVKLKNVDFSESCIKNVDFSGASLENISFCEASIQNVSFINSDLKNVNFSRANFKDIRFQFSDIKGVNFSGSRLNDISFEHSCFSETNFSEAVLVQVLFIMLYGFKDVSFQKARLDKVSFDTNFLEDINFRETCFVDVFFNEIDFKESDFSNAEFKRIYWCDTYWQYADGLQLARNVPKNVLGNPT
ncbi:pentapeptide repeat-containing protein [Leptolyngbya sp. PCC 6406]|uniref:pentapeptide repeat-containing protein n=1 Tax=Leptolyngbya sp. PCC 6406 TaxID=1173264 RepID=UPI000487648A|nr:pentapeptide repeat-containing protein [Leptolyngbya sp. PCC 6406]